MLKITGIFILLMVVAVGVPIVGLSKTNAIETLVLTKSNTLILDQVITDDSVSELINNSLILNRSFVDKSPIYLFLRTPGGSIQAGLELADALRASTRRINTVTAFAASMGFQTVQSLGERLIMPSGVLMSHRASGGIEGTFGGSYPSQLDSRYAFWMKRLLELDFQTVRRTKGKQTLDSYQAAYANEMWLTGREAVEKGYADRVVTVTCDATMDGVVEHNVNFMGLSVSYSTFNCPLMTSLTNVHINPSGSLVFEAKREDEIKKLFEEDYYKQRNNINKSLF